MTQISVRTLGAVTIEVGGRVLGPSAGQPFAFLLYLTSRRGHTTPRRILRDLLYPRKDDSQAAHSLRQLLYRLRQLGVAIDADANGVMIADDRVSVDWSSMTDRGELGVQDLELIAQGLFPGYSPDITEAYREWFEAERSAVRFRLSRTVGLTLTQLRGTGRWDLVDVAARALLALDPLSEEGILARAEALAASGSKSASLRVIDDYLEKIGNEQPNLRLTPATLRRRISERLPELGRRAQDDRIFVGREDAMRLLSDAASAARSGTQQTVLVWGEPGIGKTRLLTEYKTLASLQGALAYQATCQPHDVFRPLGILTDLVNQLLQAPGALGCDPEGRELLLRLVSGTTTLGSMQTWTEASLSSVTRVLDDLLGAIASEALLVLLVDDAQWLDHASLKVILSACSCRCLRRVCVILASRERALLVNHGGLAEDVVSHRLNPLERTAALELTRSLLGVGASSGLIEHQELVLEQSHGNAFLLRLLCLHLATNAAALLPQTISDLLERRLENLSEKASRTIEACVVLGPNCTYARVERLLGISRLELLKALEELDDRGLLETSNSCMLRTHALLGEAVVRRMAPSVGRALHATAGAILQEECGPSQVGPLPWDCAEHWRLAGDHAQAMLVLRNCARRALDVGRPTDALATLKRAITLTSPDLTRLEIVESALQTLWMGVNWAHATELFLSADGYESYSNCNPTRIQISKQWNSLRRFRVTLVTRAAISLVFVAVYLRITLIQAIDWPQRVNC